MLGVTENLFCVRQNTPWGDYGDMVVHGDISIDSEPAEVYRTGPHVPALTCPSVMIVNEIGRVALLEIGLDTSTFSPVEKKRIVYCDWTNWDRTGFPEELNNLREPEDLVHLGSHDETVSAKVGTLYKVSPPIGVLLRNNSSDVPVSDDGRWLTAVPGTWSGADVMIGHCPWLGPISQQSMVLITERVVPLFERLGEGFLKFVPCE